MSWKNWNHLREGTPSFHLWGSVGSPRAEFSETIDSGLGFPLGRVRPRLGRGMTKARRPLPWVTHVYSVIAPPSAPAGAHHLQLAGPHSSPPQAEARPLLKPHGGQRKRSHFQRAENLPKLQSTACENRLLSERILQFILFGCL